MLTFPQEDTETPVWTETPATTDAERTFTRTDLPEANTLFPETTTVPPSASASICVMFNAANLLNFFAIISPVPLLEIVFGEPVRIEELAGIGCLGFDLSLRQEHGTVDP